MKLLTVYVHGIGDHISRDKFKIDWDAAIFHREMTYRTRAAFWSDIRYPQTVNSKKSLTALAHAELWDVENSDSFIRVASKLESGSDSRRLFMERLAARMSGFSHESTQEGQYKSKVLPLPEFLRDPITRAITSLFIKDVAAYFYDENQRHLIRQRLIECLQTPHDNFILVTHSMGTVIAYDVLTDFSHHMIPERIVPTKDIKVPLWVTIGSPLGIQEVQDKLKDLRPHLPLAKPSVVDEWLNFADRLDMVAVDQTLADDYGNNEKIKDHDVINHDRLDFTQYGPHSGTGYLSISEVRKAIIDKAVEIEGQGYMNVLSDFVVPKDVAYMINATPTKRIPVLIELDEKAKGKTLEEKRESVVEFVKQITNNADEAELDTMKRFVSAKLTAKEIDAVAHEATVKQNHKEQLTISKIWHNSSKRALVNTAANTVHSTVARLGYAASGKGISWAILDSGVEGLHPHFQSKGNIKKVLDCTKKGITEVDLDKTTDKNGHGTHVCGIIAGEGFEKKTTSDPFTGIAPEAELHVYKVLKDNGSGDDSYIIKALDHIADLNQSASKLVIQGVNLSLGGPFDSTVFACGHSPLCRELKRLWRQGVVVVIAAGNEGITDILGADGGSLQLSNDITISDPANLEECIAVGSVHKSSPHFFGPSYFSSRGPTADGRMKPDCIAPGERIISCNNRYNETGLTNYIEMSGTSMAAPVVSGLLAAFLSVRSEFIGRPDELKELMLNNCTDLKRDRYIQGHGLPNLVKMILNT
ncbi:MAG: S8 family peptidase [Candidatus Melainabacteria bacterium]|nr:S8 family peptidase [Candidatus Melainabacteria bacterium]